jgi:ribonucleoside-diphosphate reductase alpha chain
MFINMFDHKGKLTEIADKKNLKNYQNLYFMLRKKQNEGEIPVHPEDNYLADDKLAEKAYRDKYFIKDLNNEFIEKKAEDVFVRVAAFVASIEPDFKKAEKFAVEFYKDLYDGHFLPAGRVLAGAGDLYRLKTLANCFVTQIEEDNIESIYNAAYECARTYSFGGGIGLDISSLRPKDSVVHNAADSSTGAVSFMELFSLTTGLIGQSGRRGALMLTIDVKHPDILDFIKVKSNPNWVTKKIRNDLGVSERFEKSELDEIEKKVKENTQVRFANTSIKISDEFMQAVNEQKTHGPQKIIVYKKYKKNRVNSAYQGKDSEHYSIGIPSKKIEAYEKYHVFDSINTLNDFLYKRYEQMLTEANFSDLANRDVYGDVILPLEEEPFDLAIRYSGDFLLYFASDPTAEIRKMVKARDVWNAIIEANYKTAEPGLIFWSRMSKYSPSNYVDRPISCTNPCAEVPLEKGGACNLASINLSRMVKNGYSKTASVDWKNLEQVTKNTIRFLDNVVSYNELLNPLEKQRKAAAETRRLGLGTMGAADMLNQLGIGYDSTEGINLIEKVMKTIANAAYQASAELAEEKGKSPIFDFEKYAKGPFYQEALSPKTKELVQKNGLRNIALLAIAPTGSISSIVLSYRLGDKNYLGVSSGLEPIFALFHIRRSESFGDELFKVFHSSVRAYIDKNELNNETENAQTEAELTEYLPSYFFRTAHHIDSDKRVEIQGKCQNFVDHSISSTVNLPETVEPEVISDIYLSAWKRGLKGITVYRDGSRRPILSVDAGKTEFQEMKSKKFKLTLPNSDKETTLNGDDVIVTHDDRLTTVYHHIKRIQLEKV